MFMINNDLNLKNSCKPNRFENNPKNLLCKLDYRVLVL